MNRIIKSLQRGLFISTFFILPIGGGAEVYAACGATNLTWYADAGTTTWATNNNWANGAYPPVTHNNFPNANTENAIIRSDWRVPLWGNVSYTLGCLEVISGTFTATPTTGGAASRVMTVAGDYYRNTILGSITTNDRFAINMGGTAAQTFESVDAIDHLVIANTTSVTLTHPFEVKSTGTFTINAGAGTIYIDDTVTLQNTGVVLTIPTSATVEVRAGGTLIAKGGITVNGILKIANGGQVLMGNGTTLTVSASGQLQMSGVSGYVATLSAYDGGSYNLNIVGTVNANYFWIGRTTAAGLNVTGTITALSNGDFHYPPISGYAVTLGAAAVSPATWASLGFYNDASNAGVQNINASAFNVSNISLTNWAGNGGAANDNDPNARLSWGSQAPIELQVVNATASGNPPATIGVSSADTLFATFGYSLTGAGTATDITSVTLTLGGSNTAGDFNVIKVYGDANANCVFNAGVDSQIGGNLTASGSPPKVTVSIPTTVVTPSTTTQKCMHVLVSTSATAQTSNTISVFIAGTADVTNSQSYNFSTAGGPPVSGATSTITGAATKVWNGGNGGAGAAQNWNANTADWTPTGTPLATDNVQLGSGYSYPRTNGNRTVQNAILPAGGRLDFNNTANILTTTGSVDVAAGYNFSLAGSANFEMGGANNQSIEFLTTFPGNFVINKSAGTASLNSNMTVTGNFTLTAGTFRISSGYNLTVGGSVNVNAGTFIIEPGATLTMSNTRVLTVALGATLQIVGSAAQSAEITSTGTGAPYTVVINGTIAARYYAISNLGVAGFTINAGATIDATNYLQNGTFTYPIGASPVLLTLNRQVPGNSLSDLVFSTGGSAATSPQSIVTNAGAGVLTISNYTGNLTNCCTTAPVYTVTWSSPTNTLNLTQNATGPANVNQGETYNMGRWGFTQTQAGAFSDTDLTAIKITMTGTGSASDVSAARLYYDAGCTGSGGTLLGSKTFGGFPASANFTGLTGVTVQAHATTPPTRCVYVEFDMASGATSGATVGVKINASTDVTNSQNFLFNGSFSPPVDLGTAANIVGTTTTWNGSVSTAWATAGNWTGGLPTSSLNCVINSVGFNPIISAAGAVCKSLTIGSGNLTINAAQNLDVYGSLTNTGTLTTAGATLTIRDNGVTSTSQTVQSSSALALSFNKTAGGTVLIGNSALTLNSFSIPAAQNFTFKVQNADILTLPNGATITSGVFQIDGGGTVKVTNGQTVTVNGGTFYINGTNDPHPQATSNKGLVTNNGSGTWSFNATSGTVNLTGFLFDWLDTNGVVIGGTTTLSNLNGGQLRELSTSYASVKGFQFNTSGSIPGTASNVGWNWGPTNLPPGTGLGYLLASSTGCASQTISFDQWFGDFFVSIGSPDTATKVSAVSCTINIAASASPVSMATYTATPYNGAVVLDWTTVLETLHLGFNVYRSLTPEGGYSQINAQIIKNPVASGTISGVYQFFDNLVTNGVTYYYYIEDVATNGTRTLHGPLNATPLLVLAAAPAPSVNAIIANNQSGPPPVGSPNPGPGGTFAPGMKTLAEGVTLIAKTLNSMRIKIVVPAPVFTPDVLHPPYSRVAIAGYSAKVDPGKPELPQKSLMLEIPPVGSATFNIVSTQSNILNSIDVASAPEWTVVNGTLVSSWLLDAGFYSTNQNLPASPISLGSITQSGGLHYLPLIIEPLNYNPVAQSGVAFTEIVLDIYLNGSSQWNTGGTLGSSGAWGFEGALKVSVNKKGIHALSYADLVTAGVEGPFSGANVQYLRMFEGSNEIPIEVTSADGVLNAGDTITFNSTMASSEFSKTADLLLYVSSNTLGLRMVNQNADPTGYGFGRQLNTPASAKIEENHFALFHEPVASGVNHIWWGSFYAPPINPGDDRLNTTVDLTGIDLNSDVTLNIKLKGSSSYYYANIIHSLGVLVNGVHHVPSNSTFASHAPVDLVVTVPGSYFVNGVNTISLKALGTFATGPNVYDVLTLDHITVDYDRLWLANQDRLTVYNEAPGSEGLIIDGFTGNDLVAYDMTYAGSVSRLTNLVVAPNGPNFYATFATPEVEPGVARSAWISRVGAIPKPVALVLNYGSNWLNSTNGADVIYIGSEALLSAVSELATYRENQGYRTALVPLSDIYSEAGKGVASPQAIKDFIQYAYGNWQSPAPKYVVLVGDASHDYKNDLGFNPLNLVPTYHQQGQFYDYASDNWFVSFNPNDNLPALSIGRIPALTAAEVQGYVEKVIAYEDGSRRPSGGNGAQIQLASDIDQIGGENFVSRQTTLGTAIIAGNANYSVSYIKRSELTDPQMNQALINAFNGDKLFLSYLGHGAENILADSAVFNNSNAFGLSNSKLPVMVSMNCLNGYFGEQNPVKVNYRSIANRLTINPDGGAIAVWASTSLTSPNVQDPYQTKFFETATQLSGQTIGEIVRLTKISKTYSAGVAEVIGSWTLIGDPMIKIVGPSVPASGSGGSLSENKSKEEEKKGFGCGSIQSSGPSGPGGSSGPGMGTFLFLMSLLMTYGVARGRAAVAIKH